MILESVRIVADWLASPTWGVNALRADVPRDTGVSVFPAVTVLDSTRDKRVARGSVPSGLELPALLVSPNDSPIEVGPPVSRPFPPDATVSVLVRAAFQGLDTAAAERDASQAIRAVWRSLGKLIHAGDAAARERAGVQLYHFASLAALTLYEGDKDTLVTGGVLVTCRVRDTWAQS